MTQVLSQDEINALLNGLSDTPEAVKEEDHEKEGLRGFYITSQERMISGCMPAMELIHDRFTRSFRTSISKFIGKTCFVNVGGMEIAKFGQFVKKLPLPSNLHIYKMNPLPGNALMVISTPLIFALVDTLFGGNGSGKVKIEGREYTAIESKLINKVVMMVLENLEEAWAPVHPLAMEFVRSEFNPLAIAIVPPSDVIIIVNLEIELEQVSTTLTLCVPFSTIEPIKNKFHTGFENTRAPSNAEQIKRMENALSNTEINLAVQLARGSVRTRDIVNLKTGDVIQLETNPSDEAIICIEGVPKYYGHVGSFKGSKAIQITRAIKNNDQQK